MNACTNDIPEVETLVVYVLFCSSSLPLPCICIIRNLVWGEAQQIKEAENYNAECKHFIPQVQY
jgi:hypothetical protein